MDNLVYARSVEFYPLVVSVTESHKRIRVVAAAFGLEDDFAPRTLECLMHFLHMLAVPLLLVENLEWRSPVQYKVC